MKFKMRKLKKAKSLNSELFYPGFRLFGPTTYSNSTPTMWWIRVEPTDQPSWLKWINIFSDIHRSWFMHKTRLVSYQIVIYPDILFSNFGNFSSGTWTRYKEWPIFLFLQLNMFGVYCSFVWWSSHSKAFKKYESLTPVISWFLTLW